MPAPETLPEPEPPYRPWAAGRAPLLWLGGPLVAGYALGAQWPQAPLILLLAPAMLLAAGAIAVAVRAPPDNFARGKSFRRWGACFVLAGTLLAWAWHGVRVPPPPLVWLELPPREATLTVRVEQVFAVREDSPSLAGLARVEAAPRLLAELPGQRVYFRVRARPGEPAPLRGAVLEVNGLLAFLPPATAAAAATPAERAAAGFQAYLQSQGAWFELTRARVVRELVPPSPWQRWLLAQNTRLETILRRGPAWLQARYGNVYVAMLLGRVAALDAEQREAFSLLGVMHLFAISGLNVGILSLALWWCWRRVPGLPRAAGDWATLALSWLYVEITGGSPSARRAALMFTIYVVATWLGRPRGPLPAVLAAGVLTLAIEPRALWSPGFQLSYGVVLGLILYAPPLLAAARARLLPWRDLPAASRAPWQRCVLWAAGQILGLAVISWTALVSSAALTAQYFGVFSPGGLLLNLALVPLASVATCAGAAAVAAGLPGAPPFTWLAGLINILGLACTGLMQILAQAAVPIPGLHARLELAPRWAGGAATLAVLAAMLLALPRARAPRWWYYALPVAVLAGFAAFAARPA